MMFYEKFKKLYKKGNNNITNIIEEESSPHQEFIGIEESEKVHTYNNRKGIITNSVYKLSILPVIYLASSIILVFLLLIMRYLNKKSLNNSKSHLMISNVYSNIPNFYELPIINPTVFHVYTIISTFSGILIVIILYSVLKQRFKVPEYKDHNYKLYIMLLFGLMSNLLNLFKGFFPYMERMKIISENNEMKDLLKLKISQFTFIGLICFSFLFAIYSVKIINLLKSSKDQCKEQQNMGNQTEAIFNCKYEDQWQNYKIIILLFLGVFGMVYIIFLLHENKVFLFGSIFNEFFDNNMPFVINVFPYFLHLINSILIFSFYFELKYLNIALCQNLEVDYLFEKSEKEIY